MKHKRMVLVVVAIAFFVLLSIGIRHYFRIDSCLDGGGRWNDERSACEYQ